jgi:hypothetical protein
MRIRQAYKRRMKPVMDARIVVWRAEWKAFLMTKMSYRSPAMVFHTSLPIPLEDWVHSAEKSGLEAIQRRLAAGLAVSGIDADGQIARHMPDVELGLKEADDPNTQWVSNEEAKASWAAKRADLVKRTKGV